MVLRLRPVCRAMALIEYPSLCNDLMSHPFLQFEQRSDPLWLVNPAGYNLALFRAVGQDSGPRYAQAYVLPHSLWEGSIPYDRKRVSFS